MAINIIYVGRLPPFTGGAAIMSVQVLRGLARRGNAVRALGDTRQRFASLLDDARRSAPELAMTYFPTPEAPISVTHPGPEDYLGAFVGGARTCLREEIERHRPDVVLFGHELHAFAAIETAVANGLPAAVMTHGPIVPLLKGEYDRRYEKEVMSALQRADLLFVCAAHIAERARAATLPAFALVPNAVDTDAFARRAKDRNLQVALDIGDDDVVILHASNHNETKRASDVVASAAAVVARRPEALYVFLCDPAGRADLAPRAEELGIAHRCRFVDWSVHGAMPDYYNLAELVVSASQTEALSLVYLEAQASSCVLIASDIDAAREVVMPGETGLLFRTGDIGDLTRKTVQALEDAPLRARIGQASRQAIMDNHDLDAMVLRYDEILHELAGRDL